MLALILLLGILQLAVGVVLGRYLVARGSRGRGGERGEAKRLRGLAQRFSELVARVSEDVGDHHAQIEKAGRELASAQGTEGDSLAEFVLKSVAQIMQINGRLHSRLKVAESKLAEQTEQIESHLAEVRTDSLTGLPNRRAFDDAMARRVGEFRRNGVPFGMIMIDVDHFKRLNDQHGHAAGDHVLRRVAEALQRAVAETSSVARIGGEEFAVLLPGADPADARSAAERCRQAVACEEYLFGNQPLRTTISLGLALIRPGEDASLLASRADEAMYAAKRAGRDRAYFHNGRECEPIEGQAEQFPARTQAQVRSPDATPSRRCGVEDLLDPALDQRVELIAICDNLRAKMAELSER